MLSTIGSNVLKRKERRTYPHYLNMFNGSLSGRFGPKLSTNTNNKVVLKVRWIFWECFARSKTPRVRWLCLHDIKSSTLSLTQWPRETQTLETSPETLEVAPVSRRPLLRREAYRGLWLRGLRLGGAHWEARACVRVSDVLHARSVNIKLYTKQNRVLLISVLWTIQKQAALFF